MSNDYIKKYEERKKAKGLKRKVVWLDKQALKKIQQLMDSGLTKDAAINKLIKSGKG